MSAGRRTWNLVTVVAVLAGGALFVACPTVLAEDYLWGITPSPDGTRLAVVGGDDEQCALFILDPSSKQVIQRHALPGCIAEAWYGVSWALDQSWVALIIVEGSRLHPKGFFVWRVDLPSGKASRLAGGHPFLLQRPRISPKGDALVFRDAMREDLLLLRTGEKKPAYITKFADVSRIGFEWTTDGSAIWVARGQRGARNGIWRVPVDGAEPKLLSGSEGLAPTSLRPSPSGTWLAFAEEGGEESEFKYRLYTSRLEAWAPQLLTDRGGLFFDWSPKTETLAFTVNDTVHDRLAFWSPGDQAPLVTDIEAAYPVWVGPQMVAYLKDGDANHYREIWLYHLQEKTTEKLFGVPGSPSPKATPETAR
jgi:Tol biopolymer transport system component